MVSGVQEGQPDPSGHKLADVSLRDFKSVDAGDHLAPTRKASVSTQWLRAWDGAVTGHLFVVEPADVAFQSPQA
jgi:hypothetical protein